MNSKQCRILDAYFRASEALLLHDQCADKRAGLEGCEERHTLEEARLDFIAEFCAMNELDRPEVCV